MDFLFIVIIAITIALVLHKPKKSPAKVTHWINTGICPPHPWKYQTHEDGRQTIYCDRCRMVPGRDLLRTRSDDNPY